MATFAAQVDALDQSIGRIVEALRRAGTDKNTLILFLSDNGASDQPGPKQLDKPGAPWRLDGTLTRVGNTPNVPPGRPDTFVTGGPPWANVSNTPFREYKSTNFEGGIATPLIAWWPGVVRQTGAVTHEISHIADIAATCLDAAGVPYPGEFNGRAVLPMEGRSLLPVLKGGQRDGHKSLCWATGGSRAIREGSWKLVAGNNGSWELYDLATDRAESQNLAGKSAAIVNDLAAKWEQWATRCGAKRRATPPQPLVSTPAKNHQPKQGVQP
jgi:arylsulfatase